MMMTERRKFLSDVRAGGRWLFLAAGLVLSVSSRTAAGAADLAIPANVQGTLTARILEYDRALKSWADGGLTIGLVGKSTGSTGDYGRALSGLDAQGLPIRVAAHAYRDPQALRDWIAQNGVRLLYVSPDLGDDAAAVLAAVDRLPTLVATREQFQRGAALGLVVRDGRPHILVNLSAARAARMDLDPKLLQLSEVVR
jgi:hypothetical protein